MRDVGATIEPRLWALLLPRSMSKKDVRENEENYAAYN